MRPSVFFLAVSIFIRREIATFVNITTCDSTLSTCRSGTEIDSTHEIVVKLKGSNFTTNASTGVDAK